MTTESMEEGEYFTDQADKPIPPKNTWDDLTLSELIDVKLQLEENLFAFSRNPVIAKGLQEGLQHLKKLLNARLAS